MICDLPCRPYAPHLRPAAVAKRRRMIFPPLAAQRDDIDVLAVKSRNLRGRFQNIRVERAGKPTLAGDNNHQHIFFLTLNEQRMLQLAVWRS